MHKTIGNARFKTLGKALATNGIDIDYMVDWASGSMSKTDQPKKKGLVLPPVILPPVIRTRVPAHLITVVSIVNLKLLHVIQLHVKTILIVVILLIQAV